ncbi:MAG TPA: hypothetical protein VKV19_07370 [Ktedonobacteraceae bacterium]|nr:hypothetical protein [Ktedonobacteraceae bacterium]
MAQDIQDRDTSERNALALVFLVTFGILTLLSAWFVYQEFTQVFTRTGRCTVLSFSTRQDIVNTDDPTEGAQYSITFKVLLLTPDGQRLQVPGYYTSANYDASDQNTIKAIEKSYPVGRTAACGYTYLDPSGIKAIFQPAIPLEGFLFPGFFLVVSLVISVICIVNLRKKPAPEIPLPDELAEEESADPQQV